MRPSPRSLKIIAVGVAVLVAVAVYAVFDPLQSRWMPKCIFRTLTGYSCPGCGSQRLFHALLNGDIPAAFEANAFLLCALPLILLLLLLELGRKKHPRLYAAVYHPATIIITIVVLVAWTLIRNIINI